MKILPEKNAVLLKVRNPQRIHKLIPTAKILRDGDKPYVAVPYRLDETRVLNNLGIYVPSPITHRYDWPRNIGMIPAPFDAQIKTSAFLTLNTRAFVLNDLGTGKTLSALWAYDYLRSKQKAGKLLVISTLSTMERAWADELFFHFPHLTHAICYGTPKQRHKALAMDADVYIVNHHGAKIIADALKDRDDITHVVLDEIAQVARNKRTALWKSFNQIINGPNKRAAWGMTATPIPNEPTDVYAQVKLINPKNVPIYFTAFKQQVMIQLNQFLWAPRKDALDRVDEVMQPAIRFHRDQCMDLPATIYITRECALTKTAQAAYNQMHKDLVAQLEAGDILAVNEAVKASKLVQIACGTVYSADKSEMCVDAEPRMALTVDMIREAAAKTIVFVPFRAPLKRVAEYIENAGFKVGVVHGGVGKAPRDEIFNGFQKRDDYDVLVAQPGAMSHGLNLTAASCIIWYAPTTSAETYEQANGRIARPGQKNTTVIVNIEGTPVERRIYYRLNNKLNMQDILLERKTYHDAA